MDVGAVRWAVYQSYDIQIIWWRVQMYSKPCQTSKMECFEKIVNGPRYFRKRFILDSL